MYPHKEFKHIFIHSNIHINKSQAQSRPFHAGFMPLSSFFRVCRIFEVQHNYMCMQTMQLNAIIY